MSQFIDLLVFPAHLQNEFSDEEKVCRKALSVRSCDVVLCGSMKPKPAAGLIGGVRGNGVPCCLLLWLAFLFPGRPASCYITSCTIVVFRSPCSRLFVEMRSFFLSLTSTRAVAHLTACVCVHAARGEKLRLLLLPDCWP